MNYRDEVKSDIRYTFEESLKFYKEEKHYKTTDEILNEIKDKVTGNDNGSYTMNRAEAAKNIGENWGLLVDACEEFGMLSEGRRGRGEDIIKIYAEPEYCDILIREYLFDQCAEELKNELDKMQEETFKSDDKEDNATSESKEG